MSWIIKGQLSGPPGANAFTTFTSTFTVPPVGQTVVVSVEDASWMVNGQYLYVESAGGGSGLPGTMQVTAISGNHVTLLNVGGGPGLADAPSDASTYGRHAATWTNVTPEAPLDGRPYVRQGAGWVVSPAGTAITTQTIFGETPAGKIDGTNRNYTTAHVYSPGYLAVYLNGLRMRPSSDYIETGSQSFQFLNPPLAGDSLSIDYIQPASFRSLPPTGTGIASEEAPSLEKFPTFSPPPSSLEPGRAYGLSRQAPPFYFRRSLWSRNRR
jgi:hypothetical protein